MLKIFNKYASSVFMSVFISAIKRYTAYKRNLMRADQFPDIFAVYFIQEAQSQRCR